MSGKSHNLIELLPSAQSYNRNENFSSTSKTLLKNNFSRSALFHMKTRVCLNYFVIDVVVFQIRNERRKSVKRIVSTQR